MNLENKIRQDVERDLRRKIGYLKCQVHLEAPRINFKNMIGNKVNFNVSGCCPEFDDILKKKLISLGYRF